MQIYQQSESGRTAFWWSDEDQDLAKRLFHEGQSAGQISKRFAAIGRPRSRNSVVGWLDRNGLKRSTDFRKETARLSAATAKPKFNPRSYNQRNVAKPEVETPTVPVRTTVQRPAPSASPVAVEPLRLPLLDLGRNQCRMPLDKAVTEFCGLPVALKANGRPGSYCPQCARVVHGRGA